MQVRASRVHLPTHTLTNEISTAMALRWFLQRRAQFQDLLNNSGLTASRYLRLMGLAIAELICVLVLNTFVLYVNAERPLRPWINWQNVHSDFKRVDQYPLAVLSTYYQHTLWATWSIYPMSAVAFFAFFGFGREAIAEYKKSYHWVRVHIFRRPPIENQFPRGNVSLPSFVASGSLASRSKTQLSSNGRSMTASQKYDATLTFDFDNDSLYDADERRGQRSVALTDLESSGTDYQSIDEKSFTTSLSAPAPPAPAPQPPMPALTLPPAVHHVTFSPSPVVDDESSAPGTPRAL